MTAREITLDLGHHRLAALEWGPPDGFPVLAIHGWLDNAASFSRLAPLLEGFRVAALDLTGHGRSDHRPETDSHYFVDWVPEIIEAADVLGHESFALVGHSMGAGISSLVPAAVPGRVVEIGAPRGRRSSDDATRRSARTLLRRALEDEHRVATSSTKIHPDLASAVAARCHGTDLDPASARLLVERSVEILDEGVRFSFDPRLRTRSRWRFTEDQVLAFLAAIDCPTLAVRARSGWPVPEEQMATRFAAIPDLTRVDVEGGHHVHLTHPEVVAPAVSGFLASLLSEQ